MASSIDLNLTVFFLHKHCMSLTWGWPSHNYRLVPVLVPGKQEASKYLYFTWRFRVTVSEVGWI